MDIKIIDNQKTKMADELSYLINISQKIKFAVAFAKISGLLRIRNSLLNLFKNNGEAIFLLGLDFHTTDPDTLWELFSYSENGYNSKTYCLSGNFEGTATYHPKLYIFEKENSLATYIVGSSNLTIGGLERNVEINIGISESVFDEQFSDVIGIFNQLKVSKHRIIPNREYIEKYAEIYTELAKGKRVKETKAFRELKSIEKNLPRPGINQSDLYGWMRLVYDYLPDGNFSTTRIYDFKNEFKQRYPNNMNVEAKIRQQLQFLHKFGFIEKIDRNLWKKCA